MGTTSLVAEFTNTYFAPLSLTHFTAQALWSAFFSSTAAPQPLSLIQPVQLSALALLAGTKLINTANNPAPTMPESSFFIFLLSRFRNRAGHAADSPPVDLDACKIKLQGAKTLKIPAFYPWVRSPCFGGLRMGRFRPATARALSF